jgi:16S rRNA (cytosine1402-N4)-methyltransferase
MRRPRYPGKNPRAFHLKYKELQPERYAEDVQKVLAAGKTPAGMHRPIMVDEVLQVLEPRPGDVAVDCTLGFGGHARAVLERVTPGGRLIGVDVDPIELPRTESRLRAAGFGEDVFTARRTNFAGLAAALATAGVAGADVAFADLGVSSMQLDDPDRGFTFKSAAPLDMRMNPTRGESAAALLARLDASSLATLLVEYADEPHADAIARRVAGQGLATTRALADEVRQAVIEARPQAWEHAADVSVRRVFQALRIAVNDELSALEALLRSLPGCLRPGGRVAILTFHSGEDRRVKKAFQAGRRAGVYDPGSDEVIRASAVEVRANPRASSAKLRWAVRSVSSA